jgi:hypothetical protein
MATENRFKQSVIADLSKRSALQCSNPDCGAITTGPSSGPLGTVSVGQAAHIYGANPGSSRYDPNMLASDRSDISNAIWLCGNCHKLIDDDPIRFPAGLLFEWQREHEKRISSQVGKISAGIRKKYEDRHLEEFGRLSYLAERLIIEKNDFWEYRLTAEALRFEMAPVLQRWRALDRGYYVKSAERVDREEFFSWFSGRMDEISSIVKAFGGLTNEEFSRSWGASGVPGNDIEIVTACRLFAEACRSALAWEESVRFVRIDEVFEETRHLLVGVGGGVIDQAAKVPAFLLEIFADRPISERYELVLTVSLPDGWVEAVEVATRRAVNSINLGL